MNFKLDLLAKIVGNNFGISVVPGAGFAIGKDKSGNLVIYVPPLAVGDEDDAAVVRSGLCHEAVGHGRHTDFDAKRGPTPLHLAIENVLEDARIEKAAWRIYPKTRRILEEGMEVMHKRDLLKRASNQNTPAEKAAIAVLLRLMVEELGYCQKLIEWKKDWAEAVSCFGDETMNKVWAEAVAGYQVDSTAEVIKVAARIVKLLSQGFEDQQQPKDGKGEKDKGDSQSKSKGKSNGSGDSDEGQDQAGGGQKGDPSDDDGSQDGKGKGQGQGGEDGKQDGDDTGKGDSGKGDNPGQDDAGGDDQGDGGDGESGMDESSGAGGGSSHAAHAPTPLNLKDIRPEQFDRGELLKAQMSQKAWPQNKISVTSRKPRGTFTPSGNGKAAAQRLKSSLAQRLLAVVEDEDDSLVESGMLSSNRLVDARMGDRHVFVEPGKPGERLDTAFSLLIDMSGSMRDVSDAACLAATWAIGDTLNGYAGMGLSFTVSSFNGTLYVLKDWNEPWKRGDVLSSYGATGSTFTFGAVENRLEHLVKRSEPRKVLYLITDGDIGNLEPLVNTAREMGTEIVVMMIGSESNKPNAPYLKRFSVIRPNEIATAMLKTVISLF